MKKSLAFLLFALSLLLLTFALDLTARDGGRGGGGGGRVGNRGGNMADRSPSMSRVQVGNSYDRPNLNQAATPATRAQAQAYIGKTSTPIASQANGANLQAIRQNQNQIGDAVRNHPYAAKAIANNRFNNNFWQRNNSPYYYGDGYNGWGYNDWPYVASYVGWDSTPESYTDGVASPVNEPPPQAAPSPPIANWISLGVFAVNNGQTSAPTTLYLQLSLNNEGAIDGTLYNRTLDTTQPLIGYIDPKTQKAVWKVSTRENSPIMEAGLYNLTQPIASSQLFFYDGQIQNWLLVRLNTEP